MSGAAKFSIRTFGAWERANAIFPGIAQKAARAASDTLNAEGLRFRDQVRQGLLSGAPGGQQFAPLSPLTKAISGAGKGILNRTSLMVSTIVLFRRGNGVAVGVRGAREKIADIHEGGRTFQRKLTPKQRRFLFAKMREHGIQAGGPRQKSVPNVTKDAAGRLRHNGKWISAKRLAEVTAKANEPPAAGAVTIPARPFLAPVFQQYVRTARAVERRMLTDFVAKLGLAGVTAAK